jgi:integrase
MKLIKRGKIYHIEFKTQRGGVSSVSTKQTDKAAATKIANESNIAALEHAAISGAVTAQAIGKIVTGKKLTIAKALVHYRKYLASIGKSAKTAENNVSTVELWARESNLLNYPPAAVEESSISQWINRDSTDAKASTRNVNLAALRSFFGYCTAKGWAVGDPARLARVNMKGLSHQQKERAVREVFEPYEIKRILKQCESEDVFWLFAVRLSLETSLRLGDICQLEWDCFSEAERVNVWTDKRDKRVSVPISSELSDLLTSIPVSHPRFMFPEQRAIANDMKKRASLSVKFGRIVEKCDIKGKSFHCIRHTCITRWSKEGKTLESIAELAGHSNTKTTEGYVH